MILWVCLFLASPYMIVAKNYSNISENEPIVGLYDFKNWPCPLAEDIAPCTCSYENSKISLVCQDIVELTEIEKVFSQHFPFENMGIRIN